MMTRELYNVKMQSIASSKKYYPDVIDILKKLPIQPDVVELVEGNIEEDKKDGIDFKVQINGKDFYACRILSEKNLKYNSITFRLHDYKFTGEPDSRYSEVHKILENRISWNYYFLGYHNTSRIVSWYILDKEYLREALSKQYQPELVKWNRNFPNGHKEDDTGFFPLNLSCIGKEGILYASTKDGYKDEIIKSYYR